MLFVGMSVRLSAQKFQVTGWGSEEVACWVTLVFVCWRPSPEAFKTEQAGLHLARQDLFIFHRVLPTKLSSNLSVEN